MMSLWDALRMNMMISYQELVRTFLSYLAKQDQKEHGIILGRSKLPEKSNRGRPRHN
ncbi:hypothetical protein JJB22_08255 [Escherichia coli]|nr:hypothetical protein JJB22_08255 [Escherichia coli]